MLLTPRYDGPRVLRLDGHGVDLAMPLLRQRRRFATVLGSLDLTQWAAPSRCEDWSVRDVAAHVVGTTKAWEASIAAGLAGTPTRMFTRFDPVASPPRGVEAARRATPSELLARLVETTEALAGVVTGLDGAAWLLTGESPLGHVGLDGVALHALWDSWVHERDVLLPLGLTPVVEADEVAACLRYAAALSPALLATRGSTRRATLAVDATDPDVRFVVDAGCDVVVRDGAVPPDAVRLTGRAVDLVEALTFRAPLTVDPAHPWLFDGLAAAFNTTR